VTKRLQRNVMVKINQYGQLCYVTLRKGLETIKSSDVNFIDDLVNINQQNYHKVVSCVYFVVGRVTISLAKLIVR